MPGIYFVSWASRSVDNGIFQTTLFSAVPMCVAALKARKIANVEEKKPKRDREEDFVEKEE